MRAVVQLVVALSLASGVLGCADRASSLDSKNHELVGQKAPLFMAPTLDDSRFDLAEHLGQGVIILDFWATWCGPCVAALPVLAEVSRQYEDKGVRFFAIDLSEEPDVVRAFLEEHKIAARIVMDRDGAIGNLYKVEAIPQTVIIDKEGTVQVVHEGVPPNLKSELRRELDDVLAGKKVVIQPDVNRNAPRELAGGQVDGAVLTIRNVEVVVD